MYEALKRRIFPLLRIEDQEPEPPVGSHDLFRVFRACPAYLAYNLFFWKLYVALWASVVLIGSVVLVIISGWFLIFVIPIVLVAGVKAALFYVTTRLNYDMRWYGITDRSLFIREGVWIVREITLTFANAQNVRVTQGPLQRWFGFSHVEVDTAGGGGGGGHEGSPSAGPHRAVLRGLENPAQVRDLILEQLRRHRTAGLGDPDDHLRPSPTLGDPARLEAIWEEARKLRQALAGAPPD